MGQTGVQDQGRRKMQNGRARPSKASERLSAGHAESLNTINHEQHNTARDEGNGGEAGLQAGVKSVLMARLLQALNAEPST